METITNMNEQPLQLDYTPRDEREDAETNARLDAQSEYEDQIEYERNDDE